MGHRRRGIACIFNHDKFHQKTWPTDRIPSDRPGSSKDRDDLTRTLRQLDFEVQPFDNLTAVQVRKEIAQRNSQIFFFCFLKKAVDLMAVFFLCYFSCGKSRSHRPRLSFGRCDVARPRWQNMRVRYNVRRWRCLDAFWFGPMRHVGRQTQTIFHPGVLFDSFLEEIQCYALHVQRLVEDSMNRSHCEMAGPKWVTRQRPALMDPASIPFQRMPISSLFIPRFQVFFKKKKAGSFV